jgi:hypothetical protein
MQTVRIVPMEYGSAAPIGPPPSEEAHFKIPQPPFGKGGEGGFEPNRLRYTEDRAKRHNLLPKIFV